MMRWYLKYRIRCAIDQNVELPGWVQRKLKDDRELAKYVKDYSRLIQHLSSNADEWMQSEIHEQRTGWYAEIASELNSLNDRVQDDVRTAELGSTFNPPARFQNLSQLRWGVCFAAAILLGFGFFTMRKHALRTAEQQRSIEKTQVAMTVTTSMLEKGRSVADESFDAYERTLHKVSLKLVDDLGDSALVPFETGGRWLGDVLKEFHSGAIREQDQLIEMSKRLKNRFVE